MELKLLSKGKEYTVFYDDCDHGLVTSYKWGILHDKYNFYARGYKIGSSKGGRPKYELMHRVILNCLPVEVVDHQNHNGLDNRRQNIRKCTRSENSRNRVSQSKSSKYKGVVPNSGKWEARITVSKGQKSYIGFFDTEHEAAEAYNREAIKHFGEFAKLNEITR